jgi:hypothetical protein
MTDNTPLDYTIKLDKEELYYLRTVIESELDFLIDIGENEGQDGDVTILKSLVSALKEAYLGDK